MLEYEDGELFDGENSSDSGNKFQDITCFTIGEFQNDLDENMAVEMDSINGCNLNDESSQSQNDRSLTQMGNNYLISDIDNNVEWTKMMSLKVNKLSDSRRNQMVNGIRKARSPQLPILIAGTKKATIATIDEGIVLIIPLQYYVVFDIQTRSARRRQLIRQKCL